MWTASTLAASIAITITMGCAHGPAVVAGPSTARGRPPTDAELGFVRHVASRVEQLRSLRYRTPVQVRVITAEGLLLEGLAGSDDERHLRMARRLHAVGLTHDPGTTVSAWARMRGSAASFYDSEADCIMLLEEALRLGLQERHVQAEAHLAHELTHALSAQHFGWAGGRQRPRSGLEMERRRALRMILEGEAELVQALYLAEARGVDPLAVLRSESSRNVDLVQGDSGFGRQADAYVRQEQFANYAYGLAFIQLVWRQRSWQGVDAVFRSPPSSTEQVLHPEKYFSRENPVEVTIPISPALRDAGYRRVDAGCLGELEAAVFFGRERDDLDFRAAGGWAGDAGEIYESPSGEAASVWISRWDDVAEAEEAEAAARALAPHLRGGAAHNAVARRGVTLLVVQGLDEPLLSEVVRELLATESLR